MPTVQRGVLESLRRGARLYLRLDDEGATYARELMEWRFLGFGMDFVRRGGRWSRFMADRPEIQRAMADKFSSLVTGFAAAARASSGTFRDNVTGVRLNELESMRLTLHGCHRIDISGSFDVAEESDHKVVRLSDISFVWVDRADLHPGTVTELETGELVDDREFTAAGWDYDIRIHFSIPRPSTWRVAGGTATHERGWPPITGAPAAGFRG